MTFAIILYDETFFKKRKLRLRFKIIFVSERSNLYVYSAQVIPVKPLTICDFLIKARRNDPGRSAELNSA